MECSGERVSSPNALRDAHEENVAGRLQATAHLHHLTRVCVPDRASHRKPGHHNRAGPQQARRETGRDLEGDSWLLNGLVGPRPPGVLRLRLVLNRRLHGCVPPTQASRGPSWLGLHRGRPAEGQTVWAVCTLRCVKM